MPHCADHAAEEEDNDEHHAGAKHLIQPRRGLDAAQIDPGEEGGKDQDPDIIGQAGKDVHRGLAQKAVQISGFEQVIHHHAPADDVAEGGVDLLAYIGISRACAGIDARHAAIADGRKQHGDHGDQNRGDHVAMGLVADDAVNAHRRGRLDNHHADDDQVPQAQRAFEPNGAGISGSGCGNLLDVPASWPRSKENVRHYLLLVLINRWHRDDAKLLVKPFVGQTARVPGRRLRS